jgi:hypothetical protein
MPTPSLNTRMLASPEEGGPLRPGVHGSRCVSGRYSGQTLRTYSHVGERTEGPILGRHDGPSTTADGPTSTTMLPTSWLPSSPEGKCSRE